MYEQTEQTRSDEFYSFRGCANGAHMIQLTLYLGIIISMGVGYLLNVVLLFARLGNPHSIAASTVRIAYSELA